MQEAGDSRGSDRVDPEASISFPPEAFAGNTRCVTGNITRLWPPAISALCTDYLAYTVNLSAPNQAQSNMGENWYFQRWFRNHRATGIYFSGGVEITFTPQACLPTGVGKGYPPAP